ncbi:TIGR03000 domain-containing protein [Zavarzinella formosa]|uniref:TIGR03000 domain-containing protein n=1 Tax=Zavarzinella formosa TaxID=360055 RepID=UPI00030AA845|nr:TIGR03000 domain-containing protein [Zavarzinella formosa]
MRTVTLPENQAQIKMRVPEAAKVYADGYLTGETGMIRTLTTPAISSNQDHCYTVKVEAVINGETRVASKRVVVRGGRVTPVDFSSLADSKATSAISVNVPSKARLLIDGVETPALSGTTNLNTPELESGKSVSYLFQIETPRDGRIELETRRVTFKAGEAVVVDFSRKSADSVVTLK